MDYISSCSESINQPGCSSRSNSLSRTTSSYSTDLHTSSRGTLSRSSSHSSSFHTEESLQELLSMVKSPLTLISTSCPSSYPRPDQGKFISRKKSSSRLKTQYNSRKAIAKMASSMWNTSPPKLSLKMGLLIPSKLSLFTAKTHARMESAEFPKIKTVNSSQPFVNEGEFHQYHRAITDTEYDTYMILDYLDSQGVAKPNDSDE